MKTNGKCNNSHAPRSCSLYIGISDLRLPISLDPVVNILAIFSNANILKK